MRYIFKTIFKIVLFVYFWFSPLFLHAQNFSELSSNIIKAEAYLEGGPARLGEYFRLVIDVTLKDGWAIYSLYKQEDQPALLPTSIEAKDFETFEMLTPWYESRLKLKTIEVLDLALHVHTGVAKFYRNFFVPENYQPTGKNLNLTLKYQACSDNLCLPLQTVEISVPFKIEAGQARAERLILNKSIDELPVEKGGLLTGVGLGGFLLLAITTGFLALLTPCVLPVIPLTLNHFILQTSSVRKSYGRLVFSFIAGLTLIYSLTGLIFSALFGAGSLLALAANPFVNLISGLLFLFFALSLFGFVRGISFEHLGANLNNLIVSGKEHLSAGLIGVAFTLTSFTCNLQLIGLLLVAAAGGQFFWPLLGMFVYALSFGLPFVVLGAFPQLINYFKIKGGYWQIHLRYLVAALEVLVALKFFSNIDLTLKWEVLSRDLILWLYIALAGSSFIYVLYSLYTSKFKKARLDRVIISICGAIYLSAGVYFASGLGNRALGSVMDAFLPPPSAGKVLKSAATVTPEEFENLKLHSSLESAFLEAKHQSKPIFVDFTGYTCLNCRWMEQNIFQRRATFSKLNADFIVVKLYTDGGKDQVFNQNYQVKRFKTVALPFYAILSPDDKILAAHAGIFESEASFLEFLDINLN